MIRQEDRAEIERLIDEANYAKDRLNSIADKLMELGAVRKAKSLWSIGYEIEKWQHRGL